MFNLLRTVHIKNKHQIGVELMIHITEVGVRDGLQNEKVILSTEDKLELIQRLIAAGAKSIEVASFVNPKVVPQMADAEQLIERLPIANDVCYRALVLSKSGLERLIKTNIRHVQLSFAVSDGFNMKNIRRTTEESTREMLWIVERAKSEGKYVNLILGTVFGCPFDGAIDLERVTTIAKQFSTAGVDEITYADTIGIANPKAVEQAIQLYQALDIETPLGLHFHNTRGRGLANAVAALNAGVTRFDSSIGGIGGCPFAPKAVGNICTEDFVSMLHDMGYDTTMDVERYIDTAKWIEQQLGRTIEGMVMKTV